MFKIESYVTPILLSYVDKYVRDFKPADAQVSLWGGGVALHNLVLKADVLQQEVSLPFTLVSGRIHELLIQVPWTKIMSEPIVVTIDTIECVLSLTRPAGPSEESLPESPTRKTQVVEAPPGYMQALVRRIVSNIALRVHHLIVKYVQDDIVMSLNVKHLAVDSAGADWEPTFADIDQAQPVIRRLMRLDDLTLCLDRADADGKIRFYQEPLLYRCQLDLRILTRLVSANTRRASSLSIQLRSSKLAWGVTGDQLTMLIRLVRERAVVATAPSAPPAKTTDAQAAPLHAQSSNTAEPAHSESWSEWAWSWLPSLVDRDGDVPAPAPPAPVPLHFAAYFDDVSIVFKVMETDVNNRKRSRGVLEFSAAQTAFKIYVCSPTTVRMRAGTRSFALTSRGKCVCGHIDYNSLMEEPTFYLRKKEVLEEEWTWPEDDLSQVVETAQAVDEQYRCSPESQQQAPATPVKSESGSVWPDVGQPEEPTSAQEMKEPRDSGVEFWTQMAPQFYIEYIHERSPPEVVANPYENPPTDFQYSDWVEECEVKVQLELMEVRVSMGLIHRLSVLSNLFKELPPVHLPELPRRILTVEECDALNENLPQRRVNIEVLGLHILVHPWDHALMERSTQPPVVLDLDLPKIIVAVNAPLYPHRVCVAASQMPEDSGLLWQGARLHVTVNINSIQAKICSFNDVKARPCLRTDVKAVFHILLNQEYFHRRESVLLAYSVKIREANLCGSAARLQAAWQVPKSLMMQQLSAALKYTTLATDALNDEESVAIDLTFEDFLFRGFVTGNTTTHIITLLAAKATALHEPKGGELQQAWLFSAPDSHTNIPYLRIAVQWCQSALPHSLEYAGIYTEPAAVAVDPLFIAWLAYRPTLKPLESLSLSGSMKSLSSQYFVRRRTTGTSSSGRGGTRSSGAEVHMRRSVGSSDKEQGRVDQRTVTKPKSMVEQFMSGEKLLALHERLQRMLVNVEIGLTLVYVTMTTASALDCATVRDAMERHASQSQNVMLFSLGRLIMFSNTLTKQFWNDIRHDGPTFIVPKSQKFQVQDSFPWKLKLADVSIYTLDMVAPPETSGRDRSNSGLRSQLRITSIAKPRTVLEAVTSTVTLSVVTKQVQIKQIPKKEVVKKEKEPTPEEKRLKYFTTGMNFKPTTLKEFVRGPSKRKKDKSPEQPEKKESEPVHITTGPVVSLGIHLHADTPPLVFRLEQDQVHVVTDALHCFTHIKVLLMRPPLYIPKASSGTMVGGSRSVARSASEMEQLQSPSDESNSEKSDLIPIYEALSAKEMSPDIKTFFWFQWVVSRVTIVAATWQSKLALEMDDIITSLDLQAHYNQLKIKVASASVRHYARTAEEEWTAGVLGGRVLEAREPSNAKEDTHFMAVTLTQAQISNLPASWKEELHPKLLERKRSSDSMWEIYATLAPLEAVIQPTILNQIISLVLEMAPRSFCPLAKEKEAGRSDVHWPFCYVTAGGLRLLLTVQDEENGRDEDDTFVFMIGKITINPHPDNPICRRPMNPATDTGWLNTSGALDGHQYEMIIKNVAIRCAQFRQLVSQETSQAEMTKGTASENPALKWTQKIIMPNITPILHSLDVSCVLAPALYINGLLTCGPAIELNLLSDCALEISIDQVVMAQKVMYILSKAFVERQSQSLFLFDEEHQHTCPYATLLMSPVDSDDSYNYDTNTSFVGDDMKSAPEFYRGADSGVDCAAGSVTQGTGVDSAPSLMKKAVSVAFVEQWSDPSEFLELFVTMGTIELSLYTVDDGSPEVTALRPPSKWKSASTAEPLVQVVIKEEERPSAADEEGSIALTRETPASAASHSGKSLTENTRNVDIGKTKLEMPLNFPDARGGDGNIPLVHITLQQPNLYYWRKTTQKSVQVSLFDAWIGLGGGRTHNYWHATLLTTEKGAADPVTDIPPALATMKIVSPSAAGPGNAAPRGSIRLDVERPVMLEVSLDRLLRLKGIHILIKDRMLPSLVRASFMDKNVTVAEKLPLLYRLKTILVHQSIESVTVQTTQIGVTGSRGAAGWDSLSVQVAAGGRPERLVGRALVTAAILTAGPPGDSRNVVVHPFMMGAELEASWEAWRRAEGGLSAREPTVRLCVDVDCIEMDLRPPELAAVARIRDVLAHILRYGDGRFDPKPSSAESRGEQTQSNVAFEKRVSLSSADVPCEEHFYKDDLRSGAFKIVDGGQLPMAYQVTLHNNSVSWRYPHPRAISRLVIFPLPGQDEETPCVLELYIPMLGRWEAHTLFSVPVGEPREMNLYVPAPESVSAQMWRYRVREHEEQPPPFQFDINRFMPRSDPMAYQHCPSASVSAPACGVTAEQLSGVVRVDSCFSPRYSPRLRLVTRLASLALYLHNALPSFNSQGTALEGYYVSKPLWRAHRVLCVRARAGTLHTRLGSPAGVLLLLDAGLSSDIVECATGTMEQLVEEFRVRGGVSLPTGAMSRARIALSNVNVALHVPRLRTLQVLATEWHTAVQTHMHNISEEVLDAEPCQSGSERHDDTEAALEGRLSLWVHNSCVGALRVGQEGTEEVVPLGPGAKLAYRWRSPTAPKKLRFAIVGPSTDWHWSSSVPFTIDHFRIKLHDGEALGSCKSTPGGGVYLYTSVEERGSRLCMRLAGRLCLANMLRFNLHYKVRARCNDSNQWRTVCSDELGAETVGSTVICAADCEMTVKIKFCGDTGWSGDIPLKECPKENVPWLVKVPCEGDLPYMSVWTRVIRARSDGRIFATVWPLYVLYSHLPLDTDVLIMTESSTEAGEHPPLVQAAPGRGASTHLLAPGTTAARHNLSFQYRNIDCPVTKDAVPLHYGMTDTSVFDKRSSVSTIEEVFADTMQWLERSERGAASDWPYSIVTKHWPGKWKPALLQPRCDVSVLYKAVRAGGGCSLEVQLRPVVLLCNSAPIALTLRAHDAAPLCKLEPGTAISPPSAVLTKSFFISVEMGRETFVSGELSVTSAELGIYGAPAPGRIALDRPTEMAIQCNHKVALLTMYYEIKEDINILGMTSTYMLINRLETDIMVSALAVPNEDDEQVVLRPTTYKTVKPVSPNSTYGRSLCKFWVTTRMWRGSDPAELRLYLCVSLPDSPYTTRAAPVRLGRSPLRRPIALTDKSLTSVPVVVTQVKHEGRWVVTVAPDPCPQLLVHNNTRGPIGIAQPAKAADEPSTSRTMIRAECPGTTWYCVIQAGGVRHYSTPSHCMRYPPPASALPPPTLPFLTFARITEGAEVEWCAPVAAADGEQLLQLADGETVKMRLRTHHHSSHLELRNVDQHDISASDIRRRLIGAFSSDDVLGSIMTTAIGSVTPSLKRTDADDKLLPPVSHSQFHLLTPTTFAATQAPPGGVADYVTKDHLDSEISTDTQASNNSTTLLFATNRTSIDVDQLSRTAIRTNSMDSVEATSVFHEVSDNEWDETAKWRACDRLRLLATSVAVQLSSRADARPLLALHMDRAGIFVKSDSRRTKTIISIADVQVDNLQYESGQYDFAVVCSTRGTSLPEEPWPPLWHAFGERCAYAARHQDARLLLRLTHDTWVSAGHTYTELSEAEVRAGPLALYVEDAYVTALASLCRAAGRGGARASSANDALLAEERVLQAPLRLRALHVHPLDVTLTLHTAVRMYIALDQSPLRLSAFKLHDVMTSTERLTHALTVHYLSAAILGAGWVVGGLELLGAPGALAARVGGATGGVRGVASAAAAALLRSLSAWASSLARNLDLLAGDEEHARRAAAARRRPPQSFMAGLATGVTNFAINILGAVGGLAHHPVVGVAVGETESGATALRRGLIGALTKPLSATADLVAYAGQGLLTQTGWDPVPQPRRSWSLAESDSGWRRDCVRWMFRLAELSALAGYQVLLDGAPVQLLFTHKFLVLAHPDSERIVEMIDFRFCSVGPYQGQIIELLVTQRRHSKIVDSRIHDDDDVQISAAAMARVARYTGAEPGPASSAPGLTPDTRVLALLPAPGRALALHATLLAAVHHNSDAHFPLL